MENVPLWILLVGALVFGVISYFCNRDDLHAIFKWRK